MVRGCHTYLSVWTAPVREELDCRPRTHLPQVVSAELCPLLMSVCTRPLPLPLPRPLPLTLSLLPPSLPLPTVPFPLLPSFAGRSTMKQYLPKKPVKRGFKVWVIADSSNGYFLDLNVYVGKPSDGQGTEHGLGVLSAVL